MTVLNLHLHLDLDTNCVLSIRFSDNGTWLQLLASILSFLLSVNENPSSSSDVVLIQCL